MHRELEDRPAEVGAEEVEAGGLADHDQVGGDARVEDPLGPDALLHVAGDGDEEEVALRGRPAASRTARMAIAIAARPAFMSRTPAP